jgi:hypothetical protein
MSGMAEVLMAHRWADYVLDGDGMGNDIIECGDCKHRELNPTLHEDEWLMNHQAAALTAAGFGDVREWQYAIFRKADHVDAQPFDSAILRSQEQAEECMRLNYVASAWKWLEVRKRTAPGAWAAAVRGEG